MDLETELHGQGPDGAAIIKRVSPLEEERFQEMFAIITVQMCCQCLSSKQTTLGQARLCFIILRFPLKLFLNK